MSALPPEQVAAFVAATTRRRLDSGRPDNITDPAVYALLDGLLARRRDEQAA